jgi:hypothetical protein
VWIRFSSSQQERGLKEKIVSIFFSGREKSRRERSVLAGTFVFTLSGIALLHWLDDYGRRYPEPLTQRAWRGQPLVFTFDKGYCEKFNYGELVCGRPYFVKYREVTNFWRVMGPTNRSEFMTTTSFGNAPHMRGAVSIFGRVATFDDFGKVKVAGTEVGTVALPVGNWVMYDD